MFNAYLGNDENINKLYQVFISLVDDKIKNLFKEDDLNANIVLKGEDENKEYCIGACKINFEGDIKILVFEKNLPFEEGYIQEAQKLTPKEFKKLVIDNEIDI